MAALASTSEFHAGWHGIRLADVATDPSTAALVEAPRFLGRFNSTSGRVYALPSTAPRDRIRCVRTIRMMFVLRSLVVSGTFQLGRVSRAYASLLVDREIGVLMCKSSDLTTNLAALCEDAGIAPDYGTIDRFVDGLRRAMPRAGATSTALTAYVAVPVESEAASSAAFAVADKAEVAATGVDFLVRPLAKAKTIGFHPSAVPRASLVEYTVVHSIAVVLHCILAEEKPSMHAAVVGLPITTIADEAQSNLNLMCRSEGVSILKLVDPDAHTGGVLHAGFLRKLVLWTLRKLLKAGLEGAAAAKRASAPRAMPFRPKLCGERGRQESFLHIGNGPRDPSCFLFLDLVVRVKSYLDESWPLPSGVNWQAAKPRRSGARKDAAPGPADGGADDTGQSV
jgi:hypothetical protein